jgi:hypothetical protein
MIGRSAFGGGQNFHSTVSEQTYQQAYFQFRGQFEKETSLIESITKLVGYDDS